MNHSTNEAGERTDRGRPKEFFFGAADRHYTAWIAAGTAAFGVFSGYSLYVLWWEDSIKMEPVWVFALALFGAALMSFAFETLRSAIEGKSEPWSRSRVVSTLVMLGTFELFIMAVEGLFDMGPKNFVGIAGFILGEQFADHVSGLVNGLAVGMLWVVVVVTVAFRLRKYVLGWPYPNSDRGQQASLGETLVAMRPDVLRGGKAGFKAGVFWGTVSALVYVFLFRALFLANFIHSDYNAWAESLAPLHLPGGLGTLFYIPVVIAGQCAKYLGVFGLVLGLVAASLAAYRLAPKENRGVAALWPPAAMLALLGSPILADPAARHDLLSLAYLAGVIWGVPAILLGMLTPFLRRPAHNPHVWGLVASGAALVLAVVTVTRFAAANASGLEKAVLIALTAFLFLFAIRLFRGNWSEELWPLVALSIGLII
ncbi:MAG TPA: hypothetical protein VKR82_00820 [Candidatus Acidoferrales bacterium]|nr:hypothetical protein [Candidatus Acidoferrales bacterium]